MPGFDPAQQREYYRLNRDRILSRQREYRKGYSLKLKRMVFEAYGNCCKCCGESNLGFLSVDHVNGGGAAHRREVGGGTMLYLDIIRQHFPDDFQVLCYNCNLGRAYNGGICPHQTVSTEE